MALEPIARSPRSSAPRRLNLPLIVALFVGFQTGAMFMMLLQRGERSCPHVTEVAPAAPYVISGPWVVPAPPPTPIRFAEPPPDLAPSVSIDTDVVAPGEYLTATVTAPANLPRDAWVGVIPSHITHGDEAVNDQNDVSYQYMEGRTRAVLTFQAPATPGRYELRLNSTDANGVELATSAAFTVPGF